MKRGVLIAVIAGITAALAGTGVFWANSRQAPELNPSNIEVSDFEERIFKTLTLKNGLKVVLVSDPSSDKAAAALNVFSGSWANPNDVQGMAHFLEHMLFLGTEKFPEVDGYQTFIEQNGGSDNAYTSSENTLYFFDINAPQLEPALDRFSQFFIAPLFDADFTDRERNAVHSEYSASLQNDERRIEDAVRELINANHPASKLSIGNLQTLIAPNMTERLKAFFRENYVASNMALSVYGPQDMSILEQWTEQYFSTIRNVETVAEVYSQPMFDASKLPLVVEIEPRREMRLLEFRFPIPNTTTTIANKPNQYVGHLLGHESTGSMLSVLRNKGWAENLSVSSGELSESNTTFDIRIQLTPAGMENWQQISQLLFSHIELIRQEGIQSWIFEEQKNINEISFQFAEKVNPGSTTVSLAERLRYYPETQLLTGPYRLGEFNPAEIQTVLESLKPDNALIILVHPDAKTDKKSQYYNTPYRVESLTGNTVANWRSPAKVPEQAMPQPNPFIPTQLVVQPLEKIPSQLYKYSPQLITKDEFKTIWFEQDDEFQTPKIDIHLLLKTDYANTSVEQAVAISLYLDLINDALNAVRYEAGLAGSGYGIGLSDNGIQVRLYGYQDKLHLLLDTLMLELVEHNISSDRFAIKKAEYLRYLRNTSEDPVINQMIRRLNQWMVSNTYSVDSQLAAVKKLTAKSLIEARTQWLDSSHLELLIHGNMLEQQAREMADRIDLVIPQQGTQEAGPSLAKMPQREFLNSVNIDHSDSAFLQLYQGENSSLRERALYSLLAETMSAPYFAELRTREQLGYIVLARPYPMDGMPGLILYIQSPTSDAALLQLYSDRFLSRYSQQLKDMNEEQFLAYKQGIITTLREPEKNLYELSNRYWQDLRDGNKNFNTQARIAHEVEKISLDGFRRFYDNQILGDLTRSLTLHQVGVNMTDKYKEHSESIIGLYPLDTPKDWPDDIEWIKPFFNNIEN